MPARARSSRSFSAPLERLRSSLGWVIVNIPFDAAIVWTQRGRIRVKGEINGFPFRTSLFPRRDGTHFLLINKRMQKGAQAGLGKTVRVKLELDTEERVVTIPGELKRIFAEERQLLRWFEKLSYSLQKWITDWIVDAKTEATRQRRSEQVAEQLLSTMEAERELPPVIKLAFARNPRALKGWNQMSPTRRRGQLLAIFHYRTPESRARRIAKAVDEAEAFAEKKADKKYPKDY